MCLIGVVFCLGSQSPKIGLSWKKG